MSLATIVKGNTFSLAIPLQVYAVEDGEVVLRDYIPESGDAITIRLKGERRNYTYIPSTNNNTAFIHLEGSEVVGVYAVEVEIVKDDDSKLTSMRFEQLSIVESIDELNEGQITEGIEQGAIYLDPEIFIAGKDGRGIVSIVKTATSGLVDTYTITYTDNTTSTFNVTNGKDGINGQDGVDGADGVGIASITKTGTQGLVDTYTITMTNGTTYTYQVTNGKDGENGRDGADGQDGTDGVGIVSITKTSTSGLVDTYTILLTNGTTTTFTVTNGSDATQVQSDWNESDTTSMAYIKNKPTIDANPTQNSTNLVESGGVYTALNTKQDKMLIATATITSTDGSTYYDGTLDKTHSEIFAAMQANKNVYIYIPTLFNGTYVLLSEITANNNHHFIVVINGDLWWFVSSRNDLDNSCRLYKFNYQAALVSGTNIKTVNNTSILGSGNLELLTPNFCPIIEDTRSSAVAAITGVAPFSTLVDGQRIFLHLNQRTANNSTLRLTLSNGSISAEIPIYFYSLQAYTAISRFGALNGAEGMYLHLIFEGSRWVTLGFGDGNTNYSATSQSAINTGTDQVQKTITPKLIHDNAYIGEETYSSGSLKANKMYDFGTVSSALTIPSLDVTNDLVSNALNFYALRFIAGADNLSITFPTGVIVDDEPTINTGDYVEIMINKYGSNFYASIKVWQAQSQNS